MSECLSECQKELQSKSSVERANTKMDKFVKDQLEMSGHISQDLETDKRKNETGDLVISNEMAQKVSHRISDQAENEKLAARMQVVWIKNKIKIPKQLAARTSLKQLA